MHSHIIHVLDPNTHTLAHLLYDAYVVWLRSYLSFVFEYVVIQLYTSEIFLPEFNCRINDEMGYTEW